MTSPGAHKQMTMPCNHDNRDDSYPQQAPHLAWCAVCAKCSFSCAYVNATAPVTHTHWHGVMCSEHFCSVFIWSKQTDLQLGVNSLLWMYYQFNHRRQCPETGIWYEMSPHFSTQSTVLQVLNHEPKYWKNKMFDLLGHWRYECKYSDELSDIKIQLLIILFVHN